MDKEILVKRAKNGDQQCFCELYDLYKDRLYRYAFYRLGNRCDAEDAVADCVLSAYSQIGKLKKVSSFEPWLFRILYCSCASQLKKQIDRRKLVDLADYDNIPAFDNDKTALRESLDQLSGEEREIVLLSVVVGLKSREIGELVGLTPGAVRSKLSRSLAKMRNFLE